jgi:microcystin-dependent protein
MANPFLGQIMAVAFNFAPKTWAFCNGQLMTINQNQALFALIGTTFGGNGSTTFALPNLQGRIPISSGQGQGLSSYVLGEISGFPAITLASNQVPTHGHTAFASSNGVAAGAPAGNALASNVSMYASGHAPTTPMNSGSIQPTGGSQPHENRQPYLVINWCIALQGIFPTRG